MLSVSNLTVTFRRNGETFNALQDVSIRIPDGSIVGLVGESGSGKSTLSRVITGLLEPTSGSVNKSDYKTGEIQMIFQDANAALDPRQKIGDAILEVQKAHGIDVDMVALLEKVGLDKSYATRLPSELSGGQCQRISIARALAMRPKLLIGDEPVSALDVSVSARILRLLKDLVKNEGISLLLVSHDLAVVSAICDYMYVLEKGYIREEGEPNKVLAHPKHPYTQKLLASIPRMDEETTI